MSSKKPLEYSKLLFAICSKPNIFISYIYFTKCLIATYYYFYLSFPCDS